MKGKGVTIILILLGTIAVYLIAVEVNNELYSEELNFSEDTSIPEKIQWISISIALINFIFCLLLMRFFKKQKRVRRSDF